MKKLKLDENFPPSLVSIFRQNDIDTSSVFEQEMCGSDDDTVFDVCMKEERSLITFDLDFANIIRYPANKAYGIIIVRSKKKMSLAEIKNICIKLVDVVIHYDLRGKLIIVEDAKIRVRNPED
jgi:predicted nuclease of predicted toxin-antitoxin system